MPHRHVPKNVRTPHKSLWEKNKELRAMKSAMAKEQRWVTYPKMAFYEVIWAELGNNYIHFIKNPWLACMFLLI